MADFDFKAASESMMDFIKKVETEIGPRLPGSDEERAGAKLIKEESARSRTSVSADLSRLSRSLFTR